jgi:hypothetical protein
MPRILGQALPLPPGHDCQPFQRRFSAVSALKGMPVNMNVNMERKVAVVDGAAIHMFA